MFKDITKIKLIYFLTITIFVILLTYLIIKLFPVYGSVISFIIRLLLPFIIACFIAYLLYPVVVWLEQYNFPNVLSILLIYLVFIGGMIYLIYRVYPTIMIQLRDLNEHIPQFIKMYEDTIYQIYVSTSFLPEAVHETEDSKGNKILTVSSQAQIALLVEAVKTLSARVKELESKLM